MSLAIVPAGHAEAAAHEQGTREVRAKHEAALLDAFERLGAAAQHRAGAEGGATLPPPHCAAFDASHFDEWHDPAPLSRAEQLLVAVLLCAVSSIVGYAAGLIYAGLMR